MGSLETLSLPPATNAASLGGDREGRLRELDVVGSKSLAGGPFYEVSHTMAQLLSPTLIGDSIICFEPASDGLGVGFLEFRRGWMGQWKWVVKQT